MRSYGWLALKWDEINCFWLAIELRKHDLGLRVHIPDISTCRREIVSLS
jgi:hypothetical protein